MLNIISNWKNYTLIILLVTGITFNLLQRHQLKQLEDKYQNCNNKIITQQNASEALVALQKRILELKEQEAAERAQRSLKRKDEIMAMEIGDKCEDGISFLIEQR